MRILFLSLFILIGAATSARAEGYRGFLNPGLQCRSAIRAAERSAGIPEHLMEAIGRVESGRPGPHGTVNPWPWSIDVEGSDYVYDTKAEVIAAVEALQAKGVRSIDVGCMQVNLMYHPHAFASLQEAFDPVANAHYAARFLVELKSETGSWDKATAWYHSATPELGEPYQRKVMAVLPEEKRRDPEDLRMDLASAWAATLPSAQRGGSSMLANRPAFGRLSPPRGGGNGRGLDFYRARPIPLASRSIGRAPL
jgi:hypothetical protein